MPRFTVDRQFGPFTWAGLTGLRCVSFLKIGYVGVIGIPLAAYALRKAQTLGIEINMPITIFWMYLGSMLLAMGHLLNEIGCPYLVKKFPVLHEFRAQLAESFSYQSLIEYARQENLLGRVKRRLQTEQVLSEEELNDLSRLVTEVVIDMNRNAPVEPSPAENTDDDPSELWTRANESMFALRCSIVTLYAASALILGFFSVRQFLVVFTATFGANWLQPIFF